MNLRDLEYVIAVAESRHFGRAAERCFVSQPTLSGQIKKLEEFLGVAIFERTKRSVELTPIGGEILARAREVMAQAQAIEELAKAHQDPLAGPLRIGVIPTLSPYLVPLIVRPLKTRYPKLRLSLSEEFTSILLGRLRSHEIDAILIATPIDEPGLATRRLFDEPFWLAHPRNHPLYTREEITRQDLEGLDLLLLADGHCLTRQVMEACGLSDRPHKGEMGDLRVSSLETILQLVGAGFGCTLVPALATRGAWMTDGGIIARKLDLPDSFRRISMVYRESFPRRRALEAFAEVVRGALPNSVRLVADS